MSVRGTTAKPGIIFDLDGTLADTLDDITDCMNYVFARIGRPLVSCEQIRGLIGEGLMTLLQRASGIDDTNTITQVVDRYRSVYTERMLRKTRLYPGIEPVLDALTASAIPMCVLSNKPHEYTAPICKALLGRWPFVRFRGCAGDKTRKPDATIALELAGEMGRQPSEVYFVGDSSIDILTARHAGMIPVAVRWGYRDRDDVATAEPLFYVDEPMQLTELILTHGARGRD